MGKTKTQLLLSPFPFEISVRLFLRPIGQNHSGPGVSLCLSRLPLLS
jgi:hypothetical protein